MRMSHQKWLLCSLLLAVVASLLLLLSQTPDFAAWLDVDRNTSSRHRSSLPPRLSLDLGFLRMWLDIWEGTSPVTFNSEASRPAEVSGNGDGPAGLNDVTDRGLQSATCTPRHHVVFWKVHKTGSSTVANIIQRYGYTRHLNFVLPRKRLHAVGYNYLNKPGEPLTTRSLIPPPVGQHYDLLWNHGVYNRTFIRSIMPPDTVYVTMLRQPLQQFVSAFEYYGNIAGSYINAIMKTNVSNPLAEYLLHPALYEPAMHYSTYLRNKQAEDMGMEPRHMINRSLRRAYIRQLAADFHLVMVTEFFDESLVLLRRLLCWEMRDMLYVSKNRNYLKKERNFSPEDRRRHRALSRADYDLYNYFYRRFSLTMHSSQGPNFRAEVTYFKELVGRVQAQCAAEGQATVNSSQWHAHFTLTSRDCELMRQSELPFLDDIMMDAVVRYHLSFRHN